MKKEWMEPQVRDLNVENTMAGNGHGNGDTPLNCWCQDKSAGGHGTPHDHGAKRKPHQKCTCCETNAGRGWGTTQIS